MFYHRQSQILPAALMICSQAVPAKGEPLPQPHNLFPHLFEPPPKRKEVNPRTLPKRDRMLFRLQLELENGMLKPEQFEREVAKLNRNGH